MDTAVRGTPDTGTTGMTTGTEVDRGAGVTGAEAVDMAEADAVVVDTAAGAATDRPRAGQLALSMTARSMRRSGMSHMIATAT